mgnify:CR=1 FL=1
MNNNKIIINIQKYRTKILLHLLIFNVMIYFYYLYIILKETINNEIDYKSAREWVGSLFSSKIKDHLEDVKQN